MLRRGLCRSPVRWPITQNTPSGMRIFSQRGESHRSTSPTRLGEQWWALGRRPGNRRECRGGVTRRRTENANGKLLAPNTATGAESLHAPECRISAAVFRSGSAVSIRGRAQVPHRARGEQTKLPRRCVRARALRRAQGNPVSSGWPRGSNSSPIDFDFVPRWLRRNFARSASLVCGRRVNAVFLAKNAGPINRPSRGSLHERGPTVFLTVERIDGVERTAGRGRAFATDERLSVVEVM